MNAQQPREVAILRSHRPRSSLRLALLAVSLTALAPITAGATFVEGPAAQAPVAMTTAQAATPGYLTIQFGRAMWTVANGCTAIPGALTLAQIAQDLQARSMTATGTVVVDRVDSGTKRYCQGDDMYANWTDLASLNTTYGWQFVSDGLTHGDMTKMTPAQQQQESCGSLSPLESHGFNSAWGLFAYGDNHFTNQIQTNVVSTCFAYGRTYRGGVNMRANMKAPWFQNTNSITGGECNVAGQACYKLSTTNGKHYESPATFEKLVAGEGSNQWIDLQFYRLVTGSGNISPELSWNCTSSNWQLHWTSSTEMYCQNDFDAIMSDVPAGVVTADPATVATAWGRTPPS